MRPRTPAARYYAPKTKTEFSIKPKKTKDPAPGSYNVEDAIKKTQWGTNVGVFMIPKSKNRNFVGKIKQ